EKLKKSIEYKAKVNNLYILLGMSHIYMDYSHYGVYYKSNDRALQVLQVLRDNDMPLKYFKIFLQENPSNYLCLKSCAYIYQIKKKYLNALDCLKKLLSIN